MLAEPTTETVLVWRKPWQIASSLFFFFSVLWAYQTILQKYWIHEDWDGALPGLGDSALRKLSIRSHMTFGVIAFFLSPVQLITPFTAGFQKKTTSVALNWYRAIHRYSGRVYVACAVMAYGFGQWFIYLKHLRLVGGYSMGLSFSLAGFFIAYFAVMTWKTAPTSRGPNRNGTYPIEVHRNYAIRSVSQIIAPVLYRYWYALMGIFDLYRTPYMNREDQRGVDLVCDDQNVCDDYKRPLDAVYAWLYWLSAWAVAEVIIACLPSHKNSTIAAEMQIPLLETENTSGDDLPIDDNNSIPSSDDDASRVSVVNYIGCIVAGLTFMVTGPILIAIALAVVKKYGSIIGLEPTTSS